MDDQQFRKTEALLYQHYDNQRQLEYLKSRVDLLAEDMNRVKELIPTEGRYLVAGYGSERTSGGGSVYHAPQDSIIQHTEEYITDLMNQRLNIMRKVSKLNQKAAFIDYALNHLTKIENAVVACIYRDKLSLSQTAEALHYESTSSIRRYRVRAIDKLITIQNQQYAQAEPLTDVLG